MAKGNTPSRSKPSRSAPSIRQKYKRVGGGAIRQNSTRIVGCEECNFMQIHSPAPKDTGAVVHIPIKPSVLKSRTHHNADNSHPDVSHKTGDKCPRCALPSLRVYDSRAEFGRAQELKMLKAQGHIINLEFQVPFQLHAQTPDGKKVPLYKYIADFTYTKVSEKRGVSWNEPPVIQTEFIVEDVKPKGGIVTDVFMMKKKHFEIEYALDLLIVER